MAEKMSAGLALFNMHLNNADQRARQVMIEMGELGKQWLAEIDALEQEGNGIMYILQVPLTPAIASYVSLVTAFVNEKPPEKVTDVRLIDRDFGQLLSEYGPAFLPSRVSDAAHDMAITLPDGLALVYWDRSGKCRTFSLEQNNFHFATANLDGLCWHYSAIIRLGKKLSRAEQILADPNVGTIQKIRTWWGM